MEYLVIVDEKDEVISREERDKAHRKHLLHRAIIVMICNDKNQVLLQLRKSTKKQYPMYWAGSVNGHVSPGETTIGCATRETEEELGIKIKLKFAKKFIIDDEVEHEMVHVFLGQSNGPFEPDKNEIEKIKFFDINEIKEKMNEMKMTPHCKKALQLIT